MFLLGFYSFTCRVTVPIYAYASQIMINHPLFLLKYLGLNDKLYSHPSHRARTWVWMPLWLTQIDSLLVSWPKMLTLLQKACTWNPGLAFVSSSSTDRENCELAPQSLQSLSRCGLDPTYPPMSTKASRIDSLCRLLQPSLGAFKINSNGELTDVLIQAASSGSESIRSGKYGCSCPHHLCVPDPSLRMWLALFIHTHLGFPMASKKRHVSCSCVSLTCP